MDADAGGAVLDPHVGEILGPSHSAALLQHRDAKAIGADGFDEPVLGLHDHLAVAIDQTGLAIDVNLREAEFVLIDDAILRRDDLVSLLVDKAIETAGANSGPALPELTDPVIARWHRARAVAIDRAAESSREHATRHRENQRWPAHRDLIAKDGLTGRRQRRRRILRACARQTKEQH